MPPVFVALSIRMAPVCVSARNRASPVMLTVNPPVSPGRPTANATYRPSGETVTLPAFTSPLTACDWLLAAWLSRIRLPLERS